MNTVETSGSLELREAPAGSDIAATIEGLAVPYGVPTQMGQLRETFAPGAIDPTQVVGLPLCWRHGDPIGVVTEARNSDQGLHITAEIANTTQGRDAATLLRSKAIKGLSVGFEPLEDTWNRSRDAVTRVRAALGEISITHLPAYATSGVSNVREETTPMPEQAETMTVPEQAQTDLQLRELLTTQGNDLAALRDRVASMRVTEQPQVKDGDSFLREYGQALLTRAWTDITLDGTASDFKPIPANVSAVVEFGRPTVSAIGVQPLAPSGMDAQWMLDNVLPTLGIQSAEKAVIASGPASGKLVSAPVQTFAGGNDVSIQFMQRATAWDYPHLLRSFAEQYARATNMAVLGELVGTAGNQVELPAALTDALLGEALGEAAAHIVTGTGRAPNLVVLGASAFFRVAAVTGNGYPIQGGNVGNADFASLAFTALGLRFVCDPTLSGAQGLVMDTASVGIKENPGAPFTITANVPSKLGVDVAVAGFMAHKVLNPDGVVDLAAAAPLKASK